MDEKNYKYEDKGINDSINNDTQNDEVIDEGITIACGEESELDKAQRRNDELFDRLMRLQAEFDNYRKRTTEANKAVRADGQREVIEKLLPVLDATEQAMLVIKDESVLKGLSLILVQLSGALTSFGVKKIDALHNVLDPNIHEVIALKPSPENAGKVIEVFRSGYTMNERVLRPASVIIGE